MTNPTFAKISIRGCNIAVMRLADVGGVPIRATAAAMAEMIAKDTEKWAKVVKQAGIQPE